MPVSSEPFYGGSLIQGVGSFHKTDLARLNRNRRRLSPVQRRIVDLASMKNYKTPDSLYNALHQATQHPHLTAELVPKPLQANPATFLAASHGLDTLRGLVDGPSDGRPPGDGPSDGPPSRKPPGGPPPGDDRPTPPVPPGDTPPPPDERPTPPASPSRAVQTEEGPPARSSRKTQAQPSTSSGTAQAVPRTRNDQTQTRGRPTRNRATQTRRGEAPAEDLPVRRGPSRVPAWARHRRNVNTGRFTVGVSLQGPVFAARYMTSIVYSSVRSAAYHMGFMAHVVTQFGGQAALRSLTYVMVFRLVSDQHISGVFHVIHETTESFGLAQRPGLGDYTPLEATIEAAMHGWGTVLSIHRQADRYTAEEFWRQSLMAMGRDSVPGHFEARRAYEAMLRNNTIHADAFRFILNPMNLTRPVDWILPPRADPAHFDIVQHLRHDRHLATRAVGTVLQLANSPLFTVQLHTRFNAMLQGMGLETGQTRTGQYADIAYDGILHLRDGLNRMMAPIEEEFGTGHAYVDEHGGRIYGEGPRAQRRYVYEALANVFGASALLFGVWAQGGRVQQAVYDRAFPQGQPRAEVEEPPPPPQAQDEEPPEPPPAPVEEPDVPHIREQAQEVDDHPSASRSRVVDDVLRPINMAVRQYDRARIREGSREYDLARSRARQQAVRDAIDGGLATLDEMAPDEWSNLRAALRERRDSRPPIAYTLRRPGAPYSMFMRSDLQGDDPGALDDSPELLGGDMRMREPGLGFQEGEGAWRGRTRAGGADNPAIALTRDE